MEDYIKERLFKKVAILEQCLDFFGDKTLQNKQIDLLVENIFDNAELEADGTVDYTEYISAIVQHPTLVSFVVG